MINNNWHSRDIEDILSSLNTTDQGLSTKEAQKRLEEQGRNVLPKAKQNTLLGVFFSQFNNPIIYVLIITTVLSFIIGEIVDGIFILVVIFLDAILGTIQEWKAEKNAQTLNNLIKVESNVLRDNQSVLINAEELVVGDIVSVQSGDKIAADMRIISAYNLAADEAILTGESIPNNKCNEIIDEKMRIEDRSNMLYAGTTIARGRGIGVVIATGINTEIGKITDTVLNTEREKSPLVLRMENFTKQIGVITAIVAIIIAFILYLQGYVLREIFFSVIALSVSAIPEGLPVALTLALSIASSRMAKRNVLVKRLNAVESLGSCTIIASDKTGTLTLNEQTAKIIVLPNNSTFEVTGIGYNGDGQIMEKDNSGHYERAKEVIKLGVINNEAQLNNKDGRWSYIGDSIDVAFLALGYKAGYTINNIDLKKISIIPYESSQKYSAVFYSDDKDVYCTVKGSLEKVLEFCHYVDIDGKEKRLDKEWLYEQNKSLAQNGYRVIALARGKIKKKEQYGVEDIKDLTLMGVVGFIDPIREETIPAIRKCRQAGIKPLMITGDHPYTAYHIANSLEMASSYDEVTDGIEIDNYLNQDKSVFDEFIKTKKVFARVSPHQKYEIVESFKRQGEFVAVTGDGVNDAPALKSANIGIAMGSGTDVAKETGTMIITDDNFLSIVAGIEEGRNAYNNVRKVIYMLLSCGVAEILFFILAIAFNYPLPLLAIQLLWLNLVTDGIQDAALAFEKGSSDVMDEAPRSPKEKIFNKLLVQEVLLSGILIGLIVFGVWVYLINYLKYDVVTARSYIVILMVFMQNLHVLNCRSETKSIFKIPFKNNPLIIIGTISVLTLQFFVIESPTLSSVLKITTLPVNHVVLMFVLALPILLVMEVFKYFKNKNNKST